MNISMIPIHGAPIEYLVVVIVAINAMINIWVLFDAYADLAVDPDDPSLTALAYVNAREEVFRVCKQLVFLTPGVLSLYFDPPPPALSRQALVWLGAIITVSSIMALNALVSRRARQSIIRSYGLTPISQRPSMRRRRGDTFKPASPRPWVENRE